MDLFVAFLAICLPVILLESVLGQLSVAVLATKMFGMEAIAERNHTATVDRLLACAANGAAPLVIVLFT